jgi:hypothetical protein
MACNCNKIIVIIPASKFGLCAFCMQVTLAGFICSWVLVAPFLFIRVPTALFIVLTLPAALFTIWLALHLAAYFWKVARQAIRPHLPGSA